jgi:hypothetical protein
MHMDTKTVNLRDLPEDLVRRAKAHAALTGITLKEFFVQAVEMAMGKENQPTQSAHSVTRGRKKTKAS